MQMEKEIDNTCPAANTHNQRRIWLCCEYLPHVFYVPYISCQIDDVYLHVWFTLVSPGGNIVVQIYCCCKYL